MNCPSHFIFITVSIIFDKEEEKRRSLANEKISHAHMKESIAQKRKLKKDPNTTNMVVEVRGKHTQTRREIFLKMTRSFRSIHPSS